MSISYQLNFYWHKNIFFSHENRWIRIGRPIPIQIRIGRPTYVGSGSDKDQDRTQHMNGGQLIVAVGGAQKDKCRQWFPNSRTVRKSMEMRPVRASARRGNQNELLQFVTEKLNGLGDKF